MANDDYVGKLAMVKHYTEHNAPKFNELLKVKERLPDIVKAVGAKEIGKLLMVEITKFVQSYTVVRPMNDDQIAGCAYALILSSEEDYLSLQDLIVFFEGAKQGKYGRILDHIDQHVIFEMLENYRQQRHLQNINLKYEQAVKFKGLGDSNRGSEDNTTEIGNMRAASLEYYKTSVQNQTVKTD